MTLDTVPSSPPSRCSTAAEPLLNSAQPLLNSAETLFNRRQPLIEASEILA